MTVDRPLRILLVGDYDDDPRLGSAKVAHKLREEFRALGHTCDALFSRDIGGRPGGRQIRQLVAPALAGRAVARALAVHPYDVVDAASAEGLWVPVLRPLRGFGRTAIVCRSHGIEHLNYRRMLDDARFGLSRKPWTRRIWYPLSRLSQVAAAARLADRLIVLNEVDRRFALERRWQPADRIDLIPHGVSSRLMEVSTDPESRGRGALFCGSWTAMKGVTYLAAAWRHLVDAGHRVPLTILGPGVEADFVLRSFDGAARDLVTVMPRVGEAEVIRAYRQHDLLVFPSTYEGFGLVAVEAMSQGLPVVATPVGCATTLVRDGETGVLVPPRDPHALARAVVRLMGDEPARRRIGSAAAAAVAHLSWQRTAEQTLRSYRMALRSLE
ncbi:MAG TPA: glycosyltransferase family 4 protein [Vicinamibacterales bacterium]|nr:glycosyltransferase family 4 protein [Vicinamibacterales bacterium]